MDTILGEKIAEVYFFTGTGNSLYIAKRIAESLGTGPRSISSFLDAKEVKSDAELVGIVHPCYLSQISRVPNIVADFISKLKIRESAYFFAICTYGAFGPFNAPPTCISLRRMARENGISIAAQFSIKMPLNNLDYDHVPVPVSRNQVEMFMNADAAQVKILKTIKARRTRRYTIALGIYHVLTKPLFAVLAKVVIDSLRKRVSQEYAGEGDFRRLIKLSDYSISLNDRCIGCGICKRICPARNIEMVNGKPVWLHDCEMCLACDEWCPQKAIHHWCKETGKDYHHPRVHADELIRYIEIKNGPG